MLPEVQPAIGGGRRKHASIAADKKTARAVRGPNPNLRRRRRGGDNQYVNASRSTVFFREARKSLPISVGGTQPWRRHSDCTFSAPPRRGLGCDAMTPRDFDVVSIMVLACACIFRLLCGKLILNTRTNAIGVPDGMPTLPAARQNKKARDRSRAFGSW